MATSASLATASLFMLGGVPGTFHHLYFSGTTTPVMAVGATFSALEVVPLVVLGYEAFEQWRMKNRAPWMADLKWPLMFFVAVSFWNLLGAGVFGFMINPPIALYYIQGLNTTPTHAHAALFGVFQFCDHVVELFGLIGKGSNRSGRCVHDCGGFCRDRADLGHCLRDGFGRGGLFF